MECNTHEPVLPVALTQGDGSEPEVEPVDTDENGTAHFPPSAQEAMKPPARKVPPASILKLNPSEKVRFLAALDDKKVPLTPERVIECVVHPASLRHLVGYAAKLKRSFKLEGYGAEPEDIAQEVLTSFLRMMRGSGRSFNGAADVRLYLYACAKNAAYRVSPRVFYKTLDSGVADAEEAVDECELAAPPEVHERSPERRAIDHNLMMLAWAMLTPPEQEAVVKATHLFDDEALSDKERGYLGRGRERVAFLLAA